MIVPLVPLFLAANLTAIDGDFKYGPEVIYDTTMVSFNYPLSDLDISSIEKVNERAMSMNITTKFKCRPRPPLGLTCRTDETKILVNTPDHNDKPRVVDDPQYFGGEGPAEPFELNFDRMGLKEIVAASSTGPATSEIYKHLAKQLNFGTDLTAVPINSFEINEDPSTGQCKTHYRLLSDRLDDGHVAKDIKKDYYEILKVPTMMAPKKGVTSGVRITRHMNDCPYRYDYYDPYCKIIRPPLKYGMKLPASFLETELKSSTTHISFTSKDFTSTTEETIRITRVNVQEKGPRHAELKTFITMKLEGIVPAKGPLKKMNDPRPIRINALKRMRTDVSE